MSELHSDADELDFLRPVQFSLRGLMIATAVVAGILAVAGPILRAYPLTKLAVLACAVSLGVGLWWGRVVRESIQLRRGKVRCGPIRLVIEHRRDGWEIARKIGACLFLGYISLCMIGVITFDGDGSRGQLFAKLVGAIAFVFCVAALLTIVTTRLRPCCVLCEYGFFRGTRYESWKNVQGVEWKSDKHGPSLEIRGDDWYLLEFPVYAEHVLAITKAIEQILAKTSAESGAAAARAEEK